MITVVRKVSASVFRWYKQNNQSSRNEVCEICKLSHEQFVLPKSFLQNISQLCALPGDFYCNSERHHIWSLFCHCETSNTNVCHPTAYQRHHSIPRSVSRLRAIRIRLMEHSAVVDVRNLLIFLLNIPTNCATRICSFPDYNFQFTLIRFRNS